MKIPVADIQVKRHINPRFELDWDYIEELKTTDHWPPVTVTRDKILVDGFHRLEAAKRRGDKKIEAEVINVGQDAALALAARLNTTHGKRLSVLELADRIKLLIEEKGWSQPRAAEYFNKSQSWISHHVNISNNINTTLMTRVIKLEYGSARELAKLPQNKQEQAYRMARKMAWHDRKLVPSARLMAKVVKKIRKDISTETDLNGNGHDPEEKRWLKLTTLWNFGSCDPRFGFQFPGRIPGQAVLNTLYYFTGPDDLVVDPFGGSGTTLDACRRMGRRCLIYDLKPVRNDITRHDISHGFPQEAKGCDLIFLDPPYWRQKRANYTKEKGSFSEVDLQEFDRKMEKLIHDSHDTVRPGGHVALLIQNTTELNGEMSRLGRNYIDHVLDCYNFFIKTGFIPVQRINIPLTWEQFAGFDIKEAKEKRHLLGVVRDLVIMKKGGL